MKNKINFGGQLLLVGTNFGRFFTNALSPPDLVPIKFNIIFELPVKSCSLL